MNPHRNPDPPKESKKDLDRTVGEGVWRSLEKERRKQLFMFLVMCGIAFLSLVIGW